MENANAPLPIDQVRECLRPFGQSRMLPRAAYVDDAVLEWERRQLFANGWTCVGRSSLVADAGAQAAVRAGERGVLLTRDAQGRLHAFENICRHRGHELLAAAAAPSARACCVLTTPGATGSTAACSTPGRSPRSPTRGATSSG